MVNAIHRRADVILQTSLAEGFGLTVAEAISTGSRTERFEEAEGRV
jgi:hypothetical protein